MKVDIQHADAATLDLTLKLPACPDCHAELVLDNGFMAIVRDGRFFVVARCPVCGGNAVRINVRTGDDENGRGNGAGAFSGGKRVAVVDR